MLSRRQFIEAGAALVLAACGQKTSATASLSVQPAPPAPPVPPVHSVQPVELVQPVQPLSASLPMALGSAPPESLNVV